MTVARAFVGAAFALAASVSSAYDLHTRELTPVREEPAPSGGEMVFVDGGKPLFTIVTERNKAEAEFLADAFARVTGKRPAVSNRAPGSGYVLSVGDCAFARAAGVDGLRLPVQGFEVKTCPRGIAIAGYDSANVPGWNAVGIDRKGASEGTHYGVVDFAERFLGCRFFFPGENGSLYPKCNRLVISPVHYRDAPYFESRVPSWYYGRAVRNAELVKKWSFYAGAGIAVNDTSFIRLWRAGRIEPILGQHSPQPHALAKSHPDRLRDIFYTSPSGKFWYNPSAHIGNYYDVTSLRFADLLLEDYKAFFASGGRDDRGNFWDNATSTAASFGVCDTYMPLSDIESVPIVRDLGLIGDAERSGPPDAAMRNVYGRFFRHLADGFARELPGKKLWLLAYYNSKHAPNDPRWFLPSNTEVHLCLGDMPRRIPNAARSAENLKIAKEWQRALGGRPVARMCLYTSRSNPFQRAIIPEYTADVPKLFGDTLGRKGFLFHYEGEDLWHYYWAPYVCAKAQWNPDFDVDAAIDAHWAQFYGPEAGAHLCRFHRELKDAFVKYSAVSDEDVPLYPPAVVDSLERELAAAGKCLKEGSVEWLRWRLVSDYWKKPVEMQRARAAYARPVYSLRKTSGDSVDWKKVPDVPLGDIMGVACEKLPVSVKLVWCEDGIRGRVDSKLPPMADPGQDEFHNDSVELFVSPGTDRSQLYQIVWDGAGHRFSRRQRLLPITQPSDLSWKVPGGRFTADAGKDGMTSDFFIPFSAFEAKAPKFGDMWHANVVFTARRGETRMRGSSMTLGRHSNVEMYGCLRFGGASEGPEAESRQFAAANSLNAYRVVAAKGKPDASGRRKLEFSSKSGVNAGFALNFLKMKVDGVSLNDAELRDAGENAARLDFGGPSFLIRSYMKPDSPVLWFELSEEGPVRANAVEVAITAIPSRIVQRNGKTAFDGYCRFIDRPRDGAFVFLDEKLDGSCEDKGCGPCAAFADMASVVEANAKFGVGWTADVAFTMRPSFGKFTFGIYERSAVRESNASLLRRVREDVKAFSVPGAARPPAGEEEPYAFVAQAESPHRPGRRDPAASPRGDEFAFSDGAEISVPADAGRVLRLAAEDFADYLKVSMGVSAVVKEGRKAGRGGVSIAVDPSMQARSSLVSVGGDGVSVRAADERAVAQALYHLEDVMNLREGPFLPFGKTRRRARYERRMTHSGLGGALFPDGYLASIAHAGFDAVLFYVNGPDIASHRPRDINAIISAAADRGLDAYIYSAIKAEVHPDDPGSAKVFASTYGAVARAHPGAKGVVIVPEGCYFPSKDPRTSYKGEKGKFNPSRFPCTDYPQWLKCVEDALRAEIPSIDLVFWTYNFYWTPEADRMKFIDSVTPTTTINSTFALGGTGHTKRNGLRASTDDYSISATGPSPVFLSEAREAAKRGLRLYTTSNTGGRTWDFGTCPYMPVPQQWKRRFDALDAARREYGLCGMIESHHYGWLPNFVSELAKEAFTDGGMDFDSHLRAIAARDYGKAAADEVVRIWADWSDAIPDVVASVENQYGPFRVGPSYPYNFLGKPIEFNDYPRFRNYICSLSYLQKYHGGKGRRKIDVERHRKEIELLRPAGERFVSGAARLAKLAEALPPARRAEALREAGVGEYIGRALLTAANVKEGAIAETTVLDQASDKAAVAAAKAEIVRIARDEYANTRAALKLVLADSRLGWEASMGYYGGRDQLRWKLERMRKLYGIVDEEVR